MRAKSIALMVKREQGAMADRDKSRTFAVAEVS